MQKYIEKEKEIQIILMEFIDGERDYKDFLRQLEGYQLPNNQYEFKSFLYILINISNNHHRSPTFFAKIEQIIRFYKSSILQLFSNFEIFHIFHSNKRILLFIIEEKMLTIDESIFKQIENKDYQEYFLPELHPFLRQIISEETDQTTFYTNRKNGENDSFICKLIRDDSVIEFITHINRTNISLL